MEKIHKLIDISEDPLYAKGINEGKLEGIHEGVIKGKLEGIQSIIINTDFDDDYIAFLFAVPVELVKETRKGLSLK